MTEGLHEGKVCVVTGASSGIGEATALRLAGAGAAVAWRLGARDRLEVARRADRAPTEGGHFRSRPTSPTSSRRRR